MGTNNGGGRPRVELATRVKILEELQTGTKTQGQLATEYGIHSSTIGLWVKKPKPGDPGYKVGPNAPAFSKVRQAFVDALDEGKTLQEARTLAKTNGARGKKWFKAWSQAKAIAKARAVQAEKLKDPAYRAEMRGRNWRNKQAAAAAGEQQSLNLPEEAPASRTMTSRPESEPVSRPIPQSVASQLAPPSGLVRYSPAQQQQAEALTEIFEEAVNERNALRGMVAILQREAAEKDKKLAAYRRTYGDIQS